VTKLVVLFNLKPGVSVDDYERFAREVDMPIVNALPSVNRFEVLKASGMLGGGAAPYSYIEVIDLKSLEELGQDVATEKMQQVAAQFRELADSPQFIITENL
jgi:uncharacterized protein (TIGR02118 family)